VRLESERLARKHRGRLVRVNLRDPDVPAGQLSLPMGAAQAMERIAAVLVK